MRGIRRGTGALRACGMPLVIAALGLFLCGLAGSAHAGSEAPPVFEWPEWQKLYGNVVRYAAHDL